VGAPPKAIPPPAVRTLWTAVRAVVYAAAFTALWAWIAYEAHLRPDPAGLSLPGWSAPLGIALMIAGGLLALWCIAVFVVRGRGTPAPFDAPRAFVANGPYRWVRNPMYLGAFLLLVGYALCALSITALLVPLGMLALAHLFVLAYEEPALEARFGDSYRAYKRGTRRWLPGPPR
jgi:protein-S-isoprenylcysteine O-methyltransferase Ste14